MSAAKQVTADRRSRRRVAERLELPAKPSSTFCSVKPLPLASSSVISGLSVVRPGLNRT